LEAWLLLLLSISYCSIKTPDEHLPFFLWKWQAIRVPTKTPDQIAISTVYLTDSTTIDMASTLVIQVYSRADFAVQEGDVSTSTGKDDNRIRFLEPISSCKSFSLYIECEPGQKRYQRDDTHDI